MFPIDFRLYFIYSIGCLTFCCRLFACEARNNRVGGCQRLQLLLVEESVLSLMVMGTLERTALFLHRQTLNYPQFKAILVRYF